LPLAGKVFWPNSVTTNELGITQPGAQRFDKLHQMDRNGRNNGSHPQCKYTMYLHCTFKNEDIYMAFANSTTVGRCPRLV
jgi:hypothetical protein